MLFELYLAYNIIWYLTMGWSDKEAKEKKNIADNLKTEADKTRCLAGTGTCSEEVDAKRCIKEANSIVSGTTRKGIIAACD